MSASAAAVFSGAASRVAEPARNVRRTGFTGPSRAHIVHLGGGGTIRTLGVSLLAAAALIVLAWQRPGKIPETAENEAAALAQPDPVLDPIRAAGL